MNDLEKLKSAIATAREHHKATSGYWAEPPGHVDICRGAMLEALETIVKLLPRQLSPETVGRSAPVSAVYKFDEGLVERLAVVVGDNGGESLSSAEMERIAVAVLAELAKVPVELPSNAEVLAEYERQYSITAASDYRGSTYTAANQSGISGALSVVRKHIAPMIAARDAEIARQSERIAELEKQIEELDCERLAAIEERKRAEAKVRAWEARTGETQPRIIEAQSTPVDASGKTPGDVLKSAYMQLVSSGVVGCDADAIAAQAVLRAFGGEALRRVSVRAAELMGEFDQSITRRDLQTVIDAELAKLGVKE